MNEVSFDNESFEDLFENAPCGYISFRDDGLIIRANQTILDWLGLRRADVLFKMKFQDLLSVGEQILFETQIGPLLKLQNSADEIQFNLRSKSGERQPVLTTSKRVVREDSKPPITRMTILRNSDRKKFETELKLERQKAEVAAKSKSDFLSMLSHEIRTPLNAVIGVSNLLDSTVLSTEQEPFMEMLRNSSDNLLNLLNSILDLGKIDAGKIEFEKKEFQLKKFIENNVSAWQGLAQKKGLTLRSDIDEDIPKAAIGDPVKLTQILSNLLGNAIKFTSQGSVILRLKLLALRKDEMQLRFEVQDTGIGIPSDKLALIFEEFKQADINTAAKFGGTGLGLAISQKLTNLYDSRIEVASEYGKGSTFSFELKLPIGNPQVDTFGIERIANQAGALKGLSVLVADDSPDNLQLMKHIFKKWGAHAETAQNGAEVLELLRDHDYDVVLMDIQMPVMNGYDTAIAIRNLNDDSKRQIPLIAFSGSMTFEGHHIAEAGLFDAVVGKPFKPVDLIAQLLPFAK